MYCVVSMLGSHKLYADESRRLRSAAEDAHHHPTVPRELGRGVIRRRTIGTVLCVFQNS